MFVQVCMAKCLSRNGKRKRDLWLLRSDQIRFGFFEYHHQGFSNLFNSLRRNIKQRTGFIVNLTKTNEVTLASDQVQFSEKDLNEMYMLNKGTEFYLFLHYMYRKLPLWTFHVEIFLLIKRSPSKNYRWSLRVLVRIWNADRTYSCLIVK